MRIGEFARRANISPFKIRFYEGRGLLPRSAREANSYRSYGLADLRILDLIQQARSLGFTLADVARFMAQPAEDRRKKSQLIPAVEAKLIAVERHLAQVYRQRADLSAFLDNLKSRNEQFFR